MIKRIRPMSAAEQALRTELSALRRIERALDDLPAPTHRIRVLSRALEGVREQAAWETDTGEPEAPDN